MKTRYHSRAIHVDVDNFQEESPLNLSTQSNVMKESLLRTFLEV